MATRPVSCDYRVAVNWIDCQSSTTFRHEVGRRYCKPFTMMIELHSSCGLVRREKIRCPGRTDSRELRCRVMRPAAQYHALGKSVTPSAAGNRRHWLPIHVYHVYVCILYYRYVTRFARAKRHSGASGQGLTEDRIH